MPFLPPPADEEHLQHFYADKAYDSKEVRSTISLMGYEDHIKSRWQEKAERRYRAIGPGGGCIKEHTLKWADLDVCPFDEKSK